MCKLLLILNFLWISITSFSQKITTIPFEELIGGVIMIKAQVGNFKDSLNFIFDTGSSHISLDSTSASILRIPVKKTENQINGIGGLRRISQSNPMAFHLPNLNIDSLTFNVNDYASLTESYGVRIDGIVGFAFLSKFIFNVNFDSSIINIYKRGDYKYPKKGYLWKYSLQYIPTTKLELKDDHKVNIPLYIDCGAGLGLLLTDDFIRDSNFLLKNKKPIVTQIDGVGGKTSTRITTVKELKLGPYKFKNVPTYLYDDQFDLLHYPSTNGLIGNDILRRFNWVLNYAKKEIHLQPNKSYYDPFDYSYTGLSIYLIDGIITITEVIPNSPGEKAGFKPGDILLSIEDIMVTSVKRAKDLLQNARKFLRVIVIRDSKPKELRIKVESIL